jgi:hypothetical protein
MYMATSLAHRTLRAAIPRLGVEKVGEWPGELNFLFPKDAVAAHGAAKVAALNYDGSKALGIGRHVRVPLRNIRDAS